jgi:hypothetical protein
LTVGVRIVQGEVRTAASTKLGGIRQLIESIYETTRSQLSFEQHGGHIPEGVWARLPAPRPGPRRRRLAQLDALAGTQIDAPGWHFTLYDH